MIEAVLFDLDNTLLDFVKMKYECSRVSVDAMIKAGLNMGKDDAYKKLLSVYAKAKFEDSFIFQHFLKEVVGKVDYKVLSAGIVAYRKVVNGLLIPYEGVHETLKYLKNKGLILGVVTDAPKLKAWVRLTAADLSDYFNLVITSAESKYKKPDKAPFLKALKHLKIPAENVLFVGDNLERDIAGANKVGMKTAFAHYGKFFKDKPDNKDEIPTYTLKEIKDLKKII